MMDLFQNLWGLGGDAASAAPTDMSQIKVPQQAMDLAGTVDAANSQLDFNKPTSDSNFGDYAKMGLLALAQGVGGRKQQTLQPGPSARPYEGGRAPEQFNAEQFSGLNMGGLQKFAQVPGIMGQR